MLQHISLEVRRSDSDAEAQFWRQLGFVEVEPPPALAERARWLQGGPTQIHLLFADDPVIPPSGHAAVVAEDYEQALERLATIGREASPRERHWGAARSYVRTPAGHLVELMEAAPPSTT
jgi:hypothetical protein